MSFSLGQMIVVGISAFVLGFVVVATLLVAFMVREVENE
jgi:hypothetical protein